MKYNSPFMKFLEAIANMLIVSFFWVICSLPIITIVPATVSLYHTTNKIIFGEGRGKGVLKDFFKTFKLNFLLGLKVNLILIVAAFFIVIGINTGLQIYTINIFGLLYLILGFFITFIVVTMLVYIPAVISKFDIGVIDVFKLSAYFASQNILISILNVLLLGFMVLLVEVISLTIMIVPALYIDLVRATIEKRFNKFIVENNLEENLEIEEEIKEEVNDEVSMADLDNKLSNKRRGKK